MGGLNAKWVCGQLNCQRQYASCSHTAERFERGQSRYGEEGPLNKVLVSALKCIS